MLSDIHSFPFLIYKELVHKESSPSSLEILQIALKALSSEFTVVEGARSKFISESFESRLATPVTKKKLVLTEN